MPGTTYFPPLSNLISANSFPAELGTFSSALTTLLDNLRYKNLRYAKNHEGDAGFYSLVVLPTSEIEIEIPGTGGMSLLFNPNGSGNTEIPISFEYRWEILKYARQFRSNSFTGSIDNLFSMLIDVAGAPPKSLMERGIVLFIPDANPLQKFVTDVNGKYSPTNPLQVNTNVADPFDDVYQQAITSPNSLDVKTIILTDYLNNGLSFEDTFKRLVDLFESWLGRFTPEKIKTFFIPRYRASLPELTIGLRFPANILRQVDGNNVPLQDQSGNDIPGLVTFDVGSLAYSSDDGFNFSGENSFSFVRSEILRSGFVLEISEMKVDLSRTKNIPEAVADQRPEDFIGAYINDGSIFFHHTQFDLLFLQCNP